MMGRERFSLSFAITIRHDQRLSWYDHAERWTNTMSLDMVTTAPLGNQSYFLPPITGSVMKRGFGHDC
jgi:hypothetical protein